MSAGDVFLLLNIIILCCKVEYYVIFVSESIVWSVNKCDVIYVLSVICVLFVSHVLYFMCVFA